MTHAVTRREYASVLSAAEALAKDAYDGHLMRCREYRVCGCGRCDDRLCPRGVRLQDVLAERAAEATACGEP